MEQENGKNGVSASLKHHRMLWRVNQRPKTKLPMGRFYHEKADLYLHFSIVFVIRVNPCLSVAQLYFEIGFEHDAPVFQPHIVWATGIKWIPR